MAITRGNGTEIIRCHHFEHVPGDQNVDLIFGVQHHIYTVLSVTIYCQTQAAAADYFDLVILGYDTYAGGSAQTNRIISGQVLAAGATYVWNDKFSFNGHEPVDFTGTLDSIAKQDAIADQGSAVAQKLRIYPSSASSYYDVTVTFIDQNNYA